MSLCHCCVVDLYYKTAERTIVLQCIHAVNVFNIMFREFCYEEVESSLVSKNLSLEKCTTLMLVGQAKKAINLVDSELVIANIVTVFGPFAVLIVSSAVDA